MSDPVARSTLEARADFVRARLLQRLDVLRDRGRVLLDPKEELLRHPATAAIVTGSAALAVGATAAYVGYRFSTRKARARQARINAFLRVFVHPERLAPKRESFVLSALEKATTASFAAIVATVGKHYIEKFLAEAAPAHASYILPPSPDPFPSPPRARTSTTAG